MNKLAVVAALTLAGCQSQTNEVSNEPSTQPCPGNPRDSARAASEPSGERAGAGGRS